MTLMPSKYSFQKNYFKVNSFRISDCAKNVMDYTIIKCHHNRISEVEKSKRSRSLPRFCYNALMYTNLISQYTIKKCIIIIHCWIKRQFITFISWHMAFHLLRNTRISHQIVTELFISCYMYITLCLG
jgi:hypothetical protein